MNWEDKVVLVTGGTGSFGKAFTRIMLKKHKPKALRIYSRDEFKQHEMQQTYDDPCLRYFVGDVRDKERLNRAMNGVDIVVHAAALKQIPSCEYNPFEAIKTNVYGAQNVIDTAIDNNVEKVMAISTDKAVNPINLYGATKLCAEKMFIQGNAYAGSRKTSMSCCRYGNVVGSRGSVIPLFMEQRKNGELTITDEAMTRFWITLERGVEFVINCIELMHGGELFVPKMPSQKITDLAKTIAPDCRLKVVGIRPGEKLHEVLINEEEASRSLEFDNFFIIEPQHNWWRRENWKDGKRLPLGFKYSSDTNSRWLTPEEMTKLIEYGNAE